MRRFVPPLLLASLAACSVSTLLTVDLDAVPFIPAGQTQGQFSIALGESFDAPDADGLASSELGLPAQVYQDLQLLSLSVAGTFTVTGSPGPVTLELGLYLHDGTSAFDAPNPLVRTVELPPGTPTEVEVRFELSEAEEAALFALVRSGTFRIGARAGTAGAGAGTVSYDISSLRVAMSVPAGSVLPF